MFGGSSPLIRTLRGNNMKFVVRKIGMADYEFRDYKTSSKACKRVRRKMVKSLRAREKSRELYEIF